MNINIEKKKRCIAHPQGKLISIKKHNGLFCDLCVEEKRKERENNFIFKSGIKHNYKYDYSKVFYKRNDEKVIIICPDHGDFLQVPGNHVRGQGCDSCLNQSLAYTTKEIIIQFQSVHGDLYDYSKVEYKHNKHPVIIICKRHGEFSQLPNKHYYSKQGCPKCRMSHGERKVEYFLKNNNILYVNQKSFNDCRSDSKQKLKYDFYLPEKNILIEYDGEQHFMPRFFGMKVKDLKRAEERLNRVKELDKIKNNYAKKNKINLIRISYKKIEEIEKILSLHLIKQKV